MKISNSLLKRVHDLQTIADFESPDFGSLDFESPDFMTYYPGCLDTGHFFHTSLIQCLIFLVKNPKFGPFLRASEVLKGTKSKKEKMTTTSSFLGQKLK